MDRNLEQTEYWRILRRKIVGHFSLGELKVLCFDVRVDYDELAGEEKVEKVLSLISYLARRGRLEDLIQLLKEERPKVNWDEKIPRAKQQMQDAEKLVPPAKDDLILREYLEKLEEFLPSNSLDKAKDDESLRKTIHALTKTYLNQLDLWRRTRLVRHIGENNLQQVVSLSDIDLRGADLSGVNLQYSNLSNASLGSAFFTGSNLQGANLSGASLGSAFLTNTNLKGANLSNAYLEFALITDSNLQGANLSNAHLLLANLTNSDVQGANLSKAYLDRANLEKCNLFDTNLAYASLYDSILTGADLRKSNLHGASLRNAKLDNAIYDETTIWPDNEGKSQGD